MSAAHTVPLSVIIHGKSLPVRVVGYSATLEMKHQALETVVAELNEWSYAKKQVNIGARISLDDIANYDITNDIAARAHDKLKANWVCVYGDGATGSPAAVPNPEVHIAIATFQTFSIFQLPHPADIKRLADQAASLQLSKKEGDAELRSAVERIGVAETQAASAMKELATAVADHKAREASLSKALCTAKSETAAALLLAEQNRLSKCKAIADQQHSDAQCKRAISRITAQLNAVSTTADDLRAKCRQAEETIAALRSESKAQEAKAAISASGSSLDSASPSPRVNLSRHLSSAASTPIMNASSSHSASQPSLSHQPSSAVSTPIMDASSSPSASTAMSSTVPTALPSSNPAFPRAASPTPAASPLLEPVSPASPARSEERTRSSTSPLIVPISVTKSRVAGVSVPSPPLQHSDHAQLCRTVCLMAIIAMYTSPNVPNHVLTVSMTGAVYQPVSIDVH